MPTDTEKRDVKVSEKLGYKHMVAMGIPICCNHHSYSCPENENCCYALMGEDDEPNENEPH